MLLSNAVAVVSWRLTAAGCTAAIAGSHQVVDEDTASKSATPPATAAAVLAGGGAGAVAAASNAGSAAAAESSPTQANGVDHAEEKPESPGGQHCPW